MSGAAVTGADVRHEAIERVRRLHITDGGDRDAYDRAWNRFVEMAVRELERIPVTDPPQPHVPPVWRSPP